MTINDLSLIELPRHRDPRGNLSFVEGENHIPFEIKRTYWIYDVPGDEDRGGHAYKSTNEFIIALTGAFVVTVDDGKETKSFTLNRSYYGLYIPKGLWRKIENFSSASVALEFADTAFDRNDYIRDYNEYLKMKQDGEI